MSVGSVLRRDLRDVSRSRGLWAGGVGLGLLAVTLAFGNQGLGQTSTEATTALFDALTTLLAFLLPIVALVVSYLAVAGEREGGGIKFLLSVPNDRRDVFVGKLLSRVTVVTAAVALVYVPAASLSLSIHGAFPATAVLGTLALTLVYGAVFVGVGVSLSATVASRSSAIGRSLLAYFLLVLFYIFPVIQVRNVVRTVHTTILGMDPNTDLYNAVEYTSPYRAYDKAVNLVVPAEFERRPFTDTSDGAGSGSATAEQAGDAGAGQAGDAAAELPVYLTDEVGLVVLAVWLVVPLVLGYLSFRGADLE